MIFADATNAVLFTGLAMACVVVGVAILATRKAPLEENCLVQAQLDRIEKKLGELTTACNHEANVGNLNAEDLAEFREFVDKRLDEIEQAKRSYTFTGTVEEVDDDVA